MNAQRQIMNLIGAETIKKEVEGWNILAQSEFFVEQKISHNYLIPLEAGEGRTTIAKSMTRVLAELELFDFASATPFLEGKLGGKKGQSRQFFEEVRSAAIITNDFRGAVAVDISTISEKNMEHEFSEFLQLARSHNKNIIFFFFIQRLSEESVKHILAQLQNVGNTKLLLQKEVDTEELMTFALRSLRRTSIEIEDRAIEALQHIVEEVKGTMNFTYFKSIQQVISDIIYCVGTNLKSDFSKKGAISHNDLCRYLKGDFNDKLISHNRKKGIGF